MSRNAKILLGLLGLAILCGICGISSLLIFNLFSTKTDTATINADLPTTQLTVEAKPTDSYVKATPIITNDRIPFHSVVQITTFYKANGEYLEGWTGSGSIITSDGLILTNAHVVLPDKYYPVDALMISLTGNPDEKPSPTYYAEVMQANAKLDLAVIQITKDINGSDINRSDINLPAVRIGDSDSLTLGDKLTILGYPGIGGETITLTSGEVSGFTAEESFGNRAFIKTNATIAGGNSGGLAINNEGELIGVPTQLWYGGENQYVDCRVLADTNRDGTIDDKDTCVPTGGFINSLRPVKLALPFIERAKSGKIEIAAEKVEIQPDNSLPEADRILYQDNFSDPSSGWDDYSDQDGSVGYGNGEYQITVDTTKMLIWSISGNSFSDTVAEATININKPTGEGDFGFICRYKDDNNFYALEISEDGYVSIWKRINGEIVTLVDWLDVGVQTDSSLNITGSCIEDQLSFGINGNELTSVTDSDLTNGDIGLIAGTWEKSNLAVTFDNLIIKEPK
jgi:S1-C subfamily serine protease